MYSTKTGLVLGFHGCDKSVLDDIILRKTKLHKSANKFDWLGNGYYFWESSPSRAMHWAGELKANPPTSKDKKPVVEPAVLGAVLDLGHCLDLTDYKNLSLLRDAYDILQASLIKAEFMPKNMKVGNSIDLLRRELDCAVIETLHSFNKQEGSIKDFDSVKGVFWEGEDLYPSAGFKEKNHIQICVRNPNCIKGFFHPLELDEDWVKV